MNKRMADLIVSYCVSPKGPIPSTAMVGAAMGVFRFFRKLRIFRKVVSKQLGFSTAVKSVDVFPVKKILVCVPCKVEMEVTACGKASVWYDYTCPKCRQTKRMATKYPHIEYKEI